ncbi:MAG: hypothetical protein A3E87_07840 [Gammaproteobacteria bacterium RIFCSPHIGHO2_12_FULL_35_23]|nr:MAG: hypothetical protein A3E87_07840 [Gammaproteobacteria bacterium RIFCSPHIGHO2_12_FULL_35_23]
MADNEITIIAEVKPIKVNEDSPIQPLELNSYLENPTNQPLKFSATLATGESLPTWLSFSEAGVLAGKPPVGAARPLPYLIKVLAITPDKKLELNFEIRVYKPKTAEEIAKSRQEAWQALAKQGVLPESIQEIIERPVTSADIYYLLSRFASFTVWNAEDMRLAVNGKLIQVAGASDKFNIYDFEVCLVITPKDLYSHDRGLGDALKTARAATQEVYRRKWHIELGGFDKMADAAWYEAYDLNKRGEHQMEIRNYEPAEITEMMKTKKTAHT